MARLFLAGSLTKHRVDANGRPDLDGRSDLELLHWFKDTIGRLAPQIEVIVTNDPINESISEEVQQNIRRSDFMLCLFAKRCEDGLTHNWTTSPYVLSESGFGASCFGQRAGDKQRMFAFVEEGVDRDQLGLAFPRDDRVLPVFNRSAMDSSEGALLDMINKILNRNRGEPPLFEPMTLRKTVSVWRSGWVVVESLYSHRLRLRGETNLVIPHTLWRISDKLPDLTELRRNRPRHQYNSPSGKPFLRCIPLRCGNMPRDSVKPRIQFKGTSPRGNEISFELRFEVVRAEPGANLEYLLYWAYPQAFRASCDEDGSHPNSTGLRTGDRGTVADATLIVKFERDWTDDVPRSVEQVPHWYSNEATSIPASVDPVQYWHDPRVWTEDGVMFRQEEPDDAAFDVFVWNRSNFHGQVRATWRPFPNYHSVAGDDDVACTVSI